MARRIYEIILTLTIIAGVILFFIKNYFSRNALLGMLLFIFALLAAGIHGTIAHSLNSRQKGNLIVYPLAMGILFAALFFVCVFFIMPLFFHGFLKFL